MYNDPHHYDGDMDDTSMSSRASSHIFDNENFLTFDSLSAFCDAENKKYDGFDTEGLSDVDLDSMDALQFTSKLEDMRNIRSMSESITKSFGQPRPETDAESDV